MGYILSKLSEPATWHILSYSVMLGSHFYQSFIGGVLAYRALSRPQFSQLQQKIFPVYFLMQTILPLIVLATTPGVALSNLFSPSSSQFREVSVALLTASISSLLNLMVIGPATTKVMKVRKAQETKEGKKYYDEGPKSKEMLALNKKFGYIHGASSLVNLAGFFAIIAYGFVLGDKVQATTDAAQIILP